MNNPKKTKEKVARLLVGKKIKRLRDEQAWSQEKLAEKAEVNKRTFQKLEGGKKVSGDTLQRVAEALKTPVTEFTLVNLENDTLFKMGPLELQSFKEDLNEFLENRINREEYQEMQALIETVEKQKVEIALPPLPPAPEGVVEPLLGELDKPFEQLDLSSTIKRVFTETTPWVKYAPVDKNNPSLAHQLRERGFISRPYISDFGPFRVGFFRRGVMTPTSLFLAIHKRGTNEGFVIRLWPTKDRSKYQISPFLIFFYRSAKNNERVFSINLEFFRVERVGESYEFKKFYRAHGFYEPYEYYHEFFPELLNATANTDPNFELTGGSLHKGSFAWSVDSYAFERMIRIQRLKPIEIAWTIDFYSPDTIVLNYDHPVQTILGRANTPISVTLAYGKKLDFSTASKTAVYTSDLSITLPRLSKLAVKLHSTFYHPCYKNFLNPKKIDLIALTDAPTIQNE